MTDAAAGECTALTPDRDGRMITGPFLLVTLAAFAYFVALGCLLPTLPQYVTSTFGGNGLAVGLVVGSFAVSAAAARPWAGRLGDRYGRRVLLSGGALIVALSTLSYALVDTLPALLGLRLIAGFGEAAVFVGAATATQDMAPDNRRGEAASYFSVAVYSGLAFGPAIGEYLLRRGSYENVWLVASGFALLAALLGLGTPHRPAPRAPKPTSLLYRSSLGPGFVLMLGLIPFIGFAAFVSLYGPSIGLAHTAPVFFVYAAAVGTIRLFGAKIPDRLGWPRASSIALAAVALGSGLLAVWPSVVAVWGAAVLIGIGMALLYPALFSAALDGVPDHERGQAVGTFSLFFDLSQGIGAPLLGLAVTVTSYRGAFAAAALVALGGFAAQHRLRLHWREGHGHNAD
ncbi:MAG: MFS transporter [Acidimicrobiia bacterium]|nr:MFS transporter [Acidimicrobiia bacterium]